MIAETPKFEAEGRAIAAVNLLTEAELLTDGDVREAAKFIVAQALKSANAWGMIEDVLFVALRRDSKEKYPRELFEGVRIVQGDD